jgi:myo-inositol-1(or 4)-monophosphatase
MEDIRAFLATMLHQAGSMLMEGFEKPHKARRKSDHSNVVTDADVKAEAFLVGEISRAFSEDGIIGEESGYSSGTSGAIWIIDPLDGSSNYVAGLPWFGVMAARVIGGEVTVSGIYLPVEGQFYYAEKGGGATVNRIPIHVTDETDLSEVLVSYGIDVSDDPEITRMETETIGRLVSRCRNLRSTNSVYDFCAVACGKMGAYVNRSSMVWDNAAPKLLIEEAGGRYSDFSGRDIAIDVSQSSVNRRYEFISAAATLHAQLLDIVRG